MSQNCFLIGLEIIILHLAIPFFSIEVAGFYIENQLLAIRIGNILTLMTLKELTEFMNVLSV